jgi:hypothetical protein
MVIVFIAQVVDMMIADLDVFFVTALERTNAFHVAEEAIRTAMTAMEQVS